MRKCVGAAVATAAVAVLVSGCGRTGSEQVATENIVADILVTSDPAEDLTLVSALLTDNGDAMDFNGNDVLRATAGGIALVLVPNAENEDDETYSREFDFAVDGEEVVVALERTRDAGAPQTILTMPEVFALADFDAAQSRAEDIVLTWTPASADPMDVTVEADCLQDTYWAEIDDPASGSFAIPADSLVVTQSSGDVCLVDVTVYRTRAGSLDPGYSDGSAVGQVWRVLRFETKT